MNVERMLYLADQLENPTDPRLKKVAFNMKDFSSGPENVAQAVSCGTVACIGGHACILFGAESMCFLSALWALDLTLFEGQQLFYNGNDYVSQQWSGRLNKITLEEAVAAIRKMVKEHVDETIARLDQVVEEVPVAVL